MTILKLAILSTSMWQASVSTMEGQSVSGDITSLDAKSVVVQSSGKEVKLATVDVLSVTFDEKQNGDLHQQQVVELQDGSRLAAESLMADADNVVLSNEALKKVSLGRNNVLAVRLKPLPKELELEWQTFTRRQESKDLLVVQKRDSDGLDFLAGNVAGISDKAITFLLDSDEIPVPLERVFGIVFTRFAEPSLNGAASIQFANGQVVKANEISIEGEQLKATASWGESVAMNLSEISRIDFSSGRLTYLSDLDPITEEYFGLDPEGQEWGDLFEADLRTRTGLSSQWRMSRDRFMNNGRPPLTLRGQTYARGICLFPKAKVEYALDRKYARLKALVGVDDDVAFQQPRRGDQTVVALKVSADGQVLFEQLIPAMADPIELDLAVKGRNTLTIEVDFGDNSSVCDYLDLANAVLIVDTKAE